MESKGDGSGKVLVWLCGLVHILLVWLCGLVHILLVGWLTGQKATVYRWRVTAKRSEGPAQLVRA